MTIFEKKKLKSMKYFLLFLIPALMFSLWGCQPKSGKLITEKIVYEVSIKNKDSSSDWWRDNLPGPAREHLITWLMDGAKTGALVACDENGTPLSKTEIDELCGAVVSQGESVGVPTPRNAMLQALVRGIQISPHFD